MIVPASQSGATFIEAIASVSVFAAVAIGLSSGLLAARRYASFSANESRATTLARDKIEKIRTQSSGSVTQGTDTSGIFTRVWTITSNTPVTGVSRLVVTVSWSDRPGPGSVRLVTLFE